MGEGTKVIIISRLEKLARLGTVKPVHLKLLSQEELGSAIFLRFWHLEAQPREVPIVIAVDYVRLRNIYPIRHKKRLQ
jgi:hypothetical protein